MSRGFLATKSEQAAMRTAQQCRAEMWGEKTYGMYLPQKQNSAIDLETLPDLKLRLGLCSKSGGNLSVCRKCGAPCSFGRILMEREDSVSQAAGAEGAKPPTVKPQSRSTPATSATMGGKKGMKSPGLETGDSPEAVQRRKEHAMKAALAAAEARRRRAAENASKPRSPEETKEEYKRRKHAEHMRTYYQKNRERMAAYNREYKRMCAQRKAEQKAQVSAEERTARAARTDLPVKDTFAARLDLSMYNHGMSTAEIAQELHVQEATARSWVTGSRTPTLDSLASVCKLLGVSADWLLGLEDKHD